MTKMKKITRKYNILEKKIRAEVIKEYLRAQNQNRCVCFTSGNSAKFLRKAGVDVIEVNEKGILKPGKWFSYFEIAKTFQNVFDATSGHLAIPLLVEIAKRMKKRIKKLPEKLLLPTGSGETFVVLKLAFPHAKIIPVYNLDDATKYNKDAPLNLFVEVLKNCA